MGLKAGVIICSRLSSSRVPGKPLIKYNGKTQIELLINQLLPLNIPVIVAVPEKEAIDYAFLEDAFNKKVLIYTGFEDDPLARMADCAVKNNLEVVVRVTHDKIFCQIDKFNQMLEQIKCGYDYVYSSSFIPGTGYELIKTKTLVEASNKYKRVEHVSYAIKAITKSILDYRFQEPRSDMRLLIDYHDDVQLMKVIFATLGTEIGLSDVVKLLDSNHALKHMNRLPLVTIYTCALNAAKWLHDCMNSVASQTLFKDSEYLLIDDYSNDKTTLMMAKFCRVYKNARFIRNDKNIGLASSSNQALKNARGKYILRLDADDFFINKNVISLMVSEIEKNDYDALYPDCYAGLSQRTVQKGNENHHVGGTLFKTSAINHIKFTDNLRNYDSLDLFLRAKDILKIGYMDKITFTYRQHNKSMSKNNLKERAETRRILESKYAT